MDSDNTDAERAALEDPETRAVFDIAVQTLDPEQTPPFYTSPIDSMGNRTVFMARGGTEPGIPLQHGDTPRAQIIVHARLNSEGGIFDITIPQLVDYKTDGRFHQVPLTEAGKVDAVAIRQLPDVKRSAMADAARRITSPLPLM